MEKANFGQPTQGYRQSNLGYEQPTASAPGEWTTTTVITAPVSQQMNRSTWSSGICACMTDCSSCLLTAFCPVCFVANMATRMGDSCLYGYFCCPHFLQVARSYLRGKENIQGSLCDDYCTVCCCPSLTLCQISRELDHRQYPKGCMC